MNTFWAVFDFVADGRQLRKSFHSRSVTFYCGVFPSLFLLLLVVLAVLPRAEAQTSQFSYALQAIGGPGFINPLGVAVDAAGNVYVADSGNNLVKEIPAGCVAEQNNASCVLTLQGSYNKPSGVAVDASGNIYVADTGNNAVKEILAGCKGANCVETLGSGFSAPKGVAVDASGDVYVADTGNNAIKEILKNCTSNCVETLVEPPTGPGYSGPSALAISSTGNLYVADTGNNRVVELTGACTASSNCTFNNLGQAMQALPDPMGVAVDSNGNLFVDATGVNAIVEIAPRCHQVACMQFVMMGQSGNLTGLAVDHAGNLYVANQVNSEIQEIQIPGVNFHTEPVGSTADQTLIFTLNSQLLLGNQPVQITLGSPVALTEGTANLDFSVEKNNPGSCLSRAVFNSYSTCTVNVAFTPQYAGTRKGAIELTNSAGTVLAIADVYGTGVGPQVAWNSSSDSASNAVSLGIGLNRPTGIAVDGAGNVFVADNFNNRVVEIPPGCTTQSCMQTLGGGFHNPWGLAVDGADNVYVADTMDNEVKEIPAGCTSASCVVTLGGNFNTPMDVAVDAEGNVYVADYFDNAVKEIPSGCTSAGFTNGTCQTTTLGGGFNNPASVAVDSAGNVYEADNNAPAIKEIPLSCIEGENNASCVQTLVSGFGKVRKMAFDSAGDIYVVDAGTATQGSSSIKEIPVGCSTSACVETLVTGLNVAEGIALDDVGNLYIANSYGNSALEVVRSAPPSLSFASTKVGQTSSDSPQTVELANIGNAVLNFPVPTSGSNPSVPAGFSYDPSSTCLQNDDEAQTAATVNAGASCTIAIDYKPVMAGNNSGNVVVTDNSRNALAPNYVIQQIAVSGIGTQGTPAVGSLPLASSIDFNQPLSASTLTGGEFLGAGNTQIAGSYSWQNNTTSFTAPGTFSETAVFTPNDIKDYSPATFSVNVVVTTITPTVGSLPLASSLGFNQPLSASTLTGGEFLGVGNTQIAGSYSWQNGTTSFTAPGTFSEIAVFTPNDIKDYAPVTFSVQVTVISTMSFTQSSLPAATLGEAYNQSIVVSGGTAPYGYSITSGSLPVGMALSSAGVLSGTPNTAGSYAFTLTVKDAKGFTASQSMVFSVAKGSSTTTLSTSGSAANPDQGFTLIANVASTLPRIAVAPTGTVSFYNNGALLGTATVTNGVASYTVAAPQAGQTYVITASYSGDANFTASTSVASSPITVAPLDFTITASAQSGTAGSSQTVLAGAAANYALSVAPTAGSYPGVVSFSVSGLPSGATASFSPANLASNAGAQSVTMTVQTINPITEQAENHNPFGRGTSIFLGSLVLPLLGLRRARKGWMKRGLLVALLVMGGLVGVTALTGCGTSSTVGNSFQSKSYTLTVTATSASVTHSTTVNLTVN